MCVILKEIDKRNNLILEFGEKSEEKKVLLERLAVLDKELGEFDKDTIIAEIDELTADAVRLGYLSEPVAEEQPISEDSLLTEETM